MCIRDRCRRDYEILEIYSIQKSSQDVSTETKNQEEAKQAAVLMTIMVFIVVRALL